MHTRILRVLEADTNMAAVSLENEVGETPLRFSVLYGLMVIRYTRGEHGEAVRYGQTVVDLAEAATETARLVVASRSYAVAVFMTGDFECAQQILDRAVNLFDAEEYENLANHYCQDVRMGTYGVITWNLLLRGKTHAACSR